MVKNFIFVNTEAIIIGMFTLIVETWLLVLMGLHFLFFIRFQRSTVYSYNEN